MGASSVEIETVTSSGASVAVPCTRSSPPPGSPALTPSFPCLTAGQVRLSAVTARSVTGRTVVGETARSSKVAVPRASEKRSRAILHGAPPPGAAGAGPASPAPAGGVARPSRSMVPCGSRTARRSIP
ncbi:MAG: hypothetical protein AAB328_03145, partial [candidate division NC10 bacterium]